MKPSILRAVLIATLLAAQIGTVVLFVADAGRRVAGELDANARAGLVALAETVEARSALTLTTVENRLRTAGRVIELGVVDTDVETSLERLFVAELEGEERAQAIYLGRPDGSFLSVARSADGTFRTRQVQRSRAGDALQWLIVHADEHGRRRYVFDASSGYDPRARPWYRLAESGGRVGWTDAYPIHSTGSPGISASMLVRSGDGAEIGVLGMDIELRTLSSFMGPMAGDGGGSAALVDEVGRVVATSGLLAPRADGDRESLPWLESVVESPLATLAAKSSIGGRDSSDESAELGPAGGPLIGSRVGSASGRALDLKSGFERLEIAGRDHLGLVLPFRPGGIPNAWYLLVQIPVDDYAGAMTDYFDSRSNWMFGALVLLSFVAMATILGVTAPVFRIHRDATVDRLTGALVRAEFEHRLQRMLDERRSSGRDEQVVVAALDLDGFKAINDTHGHGAGDEVLVEFVRRLHGALRPDDLVGRAGGDEFLLALRLPRSCDLHATLDAIRGRAVGSPFAGTEGTYSVGVTVGVARRRTDETRGELLTRADRTLIDGKAFRKDRVYVAQEAQPGTVSMPGRLPDSAANAGAHARSVARTGRAMDAVP